jgi:hypothetical protein
MVEGHYYEHIIYNKKFLKIMEEFKKIILKSEELEKYCTHENQRLSAAMRLLVMNYVLKHSTDEEVKNYIKQLNEALKLGA